MRRLRCLSLFYNHKLIRALTCGYLNKPTYQASYDRPDAKLHRPMLRVTIINMVFTYLLIIIADVTALKTVVRWGYQFTIFCMETIVFIVAMSILEIVDYY